MLGNIISQLYRIADLLKDKKLVDKDSNNSSQTESENEIRVKPLFINGDVIGCLVKEKDFVHVQTAQTTLAQIFPNVINDISNIINTNSDDLVQFEILVENSTEVLTIVSANVRVNKINVYLDNSGSETSYYSGIFNNINEITNLQLTQGFEGTA